MKFMLIPPGEFDMGSTEEEVAKLIEEVKAAKQPGWCIVRRSSEAPQHRVRITKPFYLAASEVTQVQYEQLMGNNPSMFKEDVDCPVESVTWDDASAFCRKLSELPQEQGARVEYRLPTEAEWEYACRAGATTRWCSGDDTGALQKHAWFRWANAVLKTHPVGQKLPNAWGLYDMHGNVLEWCQDRWAVDYYAASPLEDPAGPAVGSFRVRRGGSYSQNASFLRASERDAGSHTHRVWSLGFRLARTVSFPH